MKIGQMVLLINTDGFMPPVGSYGEIVGALDFMGDHEVLFPNHPCPNPPSITWEVPASFLMPINDGVKIKYNEKENVE